MGFFVNGIKNGVHTFVIWSDGKLHSDHTIVDSLTQLARDEGKEDILFTNPFVAIRYMFTFFDEIITIHIDDSKTPNIKLH